MQPQGFTVRRDPVARPLLLGGIVAPLLYATTVIWGATLFPGYSHLSDPISALTQAGRPGIAGVQSLFLIYNALVLMFALAGISISLGHRLWAWSYALLGVTALAGLLMWPFPQDPVGAPATPAGIVHIVLTAATSLATIGAIATAGFAWHSSGKRTMALFSAGCAIVMFVSGLAAAGSMAAGWPLPGLYERITIGTFELWLLVTGGVVYISGR